jgi:hypothetical protein
MVCVPVWMVGGAEEANIEDTIASDQFEVHAVEVCANGVKPLATSHSAGEFHARLLQAEGAQSRFSFVFDYPTEYGGVGDIILKLDTIILDLDCIGRVLPKSKRTRQVTW